jgi:DNA-binding transcriptional LysR family regulator
MQLKDRIGCRMRLNDLHVLMAVAQAGNMSKAATLLNTGQPTISRSIADLERALGVRLLDRGRQGVRPTEYGRALLDGGIAVFDDLRQTVKKIAFLANPAAGEVRVGCNHFLATSFVSAVVDKLSRRYPDAVFSLVTDYVETLHRELAERNVDLLIARESGVILDERMDQEVLFEESYCLVVGTQNRWARRRKIELAELMNERWVLPPTGSTTGSVALAAFRANGLDCPRASVVAELAEVRVNLVAAGEFISIFSDSFLRFSARRSELKVLAVKQPLSRVPVGIVTLKNRTISPLAKLFIDISRELAKQMNGVK